MTRWRKEFRSSEGEFKRPSFAYPHISSFARDSKSLTQTSQAVRNSVKRDNAIGSLIALLLRVCCPPAIAWLVVSVVVDAVNLQSFRTLPHVFQECLEIVFPSVAHFHAPASIGRITFVETPGVHITPGDISSGKFASRRMTVLEISSDYCLDVQTSTRLGVARIQGGVEDCDDIPAVALTKASATESAARHSYRISFFDYKKSCEAEFGDVFSGSHNGGQFTVAVSNGRSASTGAHCDITTKRSLVQPC